MIDPAQLRALDRLGAALQATQFLPGTAYADTWEERRRRCLRLFQGKIRLEAAGSPSPLKLVISGGTNVGKSTLFNRMLDAVVSGTSALARFTKSAVLYVHADQLDATLPPDFLPGYPREVVSGPAAAAPVGGSAGDVPSQPTLHCRPHQRDDWRSLHLLDSPDIDSNYARNWTTSEDVFFLADGILFVTTPEKYNDEICVDYLRRAVRFRKRLWVLLNKCSSTDVATDLRNEILAALARDGGTPELVRVHEVPWLRAPASETGAWLEPLQGIPAEALADPDAKARAFEGSLAWLDVEARAVLDQAATEQAWLDTLRTALQRTHDDAVAAYREFLSSLDFYELDEVYRRVLREFRVPVLDDVYDALGSVSQRLFQGVRRMLGAPKQSEHDRKLDQRRQADRERVKMLFQRFHQQVIEAVDKAPVELAPVVRAWVPPQVPVDETNVLVGTFMTASEEVSQRWVENEKLRVLEQLRNRPELKRSLKAVRAVLQVGAGAMSAYLTGGLNITDLLIGPLSERLVKYLIDSTGGATYYIDLRGKFLDDRTDMFRRFLDRRIAEPVRTRMPAPIPATVRGDLLGALETLRAVDLRVPAATAPPVAAAPPVAEPVLPGGTPGGSAS